jgi:hypothetical protein
VLEAIASDLPLNPAAASAPPKTADERNARREIMFDN